MAAMYTSAGSASGLVTDRQATRYAARAGGGASLIVTELTAVDHHGFGTRVCMRLDDDRLIEGHRRLTEAVHAAGGRVASQLCHQGRKVAAACRLRPRRCRPSAGTCRARSRARRSPCSCSASRTPRRARGARATTASSCTWRTATSSISSSRRSPISAATSTAGDLAGRTRFALEVVAAVRGALGPDFPILAKLAVEDGGGMGYGPGEGAEIASRLAEAGVDAITASTGAGHGEEQTLVPPMTNPRGFNVRLPRPCGAAGSASPSAPWAASPAPPTPRRSSRPGRADYPALGRAFFADAEWGRKAEEGRAAEITPCIGCLQGCYDRLVADLPIACTTNPRATREADLPWEPAADSRRVLVIGGGIAGTQAAVTAARRGHALAL